MPNAIPAIAVAAAKWATAKIIVATGIQSLAFAKAVYATVYVATTALAYAGVSAVTAAAMKPSLPNSQRAAQPFNSTNPDWQWGFGWRRIAGPHMAWHHLDGFNIEVQVLHHGPISAYGQFYFHDDKITFDPVTGATVKVGKNYGPKIRVFSTLGTTPGTANFPAIVAIAGPIWTTQHRLDGCAAIGMIYGAVSDENVLKVYPKGPPVVSVVANLSPVYDPRKDGSLGVDGWTGSHRRDNPATWEPTENPVLQRMHNDWHRYGVDFDYRIAPILAAWATAADRCDAPRPLTSGAAVMSVSAAAGATSITLTNVTGLEPGSTIELVFPDETVTVDSVAGLVVTLDAPLDEDHGAGTQARWAIDGSMGLTEPRWRCGILMTGANDKAQVRARFMEACDGVVLERADGAWVPNVELYEEPGEDDEFVLTERHILSIQMVRGVPEDQRINEFSWKFSSPDHGYMAQPGEPWRDEADIAARGEVKSSPVDLEQVPSHLQGRELLSRRMYRAKCDLRLVVTTDGWGQMLRGRRWFRIKAPSRGTLLANLVVECLQDPDEDLMRGRLTFRVARSGPELASFNPATQGGTPPGSSYRPPPPELPLPSIVSVTPVESSDGIRLVIVMDDPSRDDLQYRVRVRQGTDPYVPLGPYTPFDAGPDIAIETGPVPEVAALQVEVASTVAGDESEWVVWGSTLDTRAPAEPEALAPGAIVALDFAGGRYRLGATAGAEVTSPASLSGWTFARALGGYARKADGSLQLFASGAPRITDLGLLIEGPATNLFLNSNAPATQVITLSAGDHTVSVHGTGSVTPSAGTATITGAAAASDGAPNTFTVTVGGTVTFTVSGSPTLVQVETGTWATSPIVTAGASVTRPIDDAKISGLTIPSGYTAVLRVRPLAPDALATTQSLFTLDDGTNNNRISLRRVTGQPTLLLVQGGSVDINAFMSGVGAFTQNTPVALGVAATAGDQRAAFDGVIDSTVHTNASLPAGPTTLHLGVTPAVAGAGYLYIETFALYPTRLLNSELAGLTA